MMKKQVAKFNPRTHIRFVDNLDSHHGSVRHYSISPNPNSHRRTVRSIKRASCGVQVCAVGGDKEDCKCQLGLQPYGTSLPITPSSMEPSSAVLSECWPAVCGFLQDSCTEATRLNYSKQSQLHLGFILGVSRIF